MEKKNKKKIWIYSIIGVVALLLIFSFNNPSVDEITPNKTEGDSTLQVDVTTSEQLTVELFVMTHCPFGLQAEKGFIPIIKTLEDNADMKIRYIHYFMHEPEEEETPRQICIREEQSDKYLDYLKCFVYDGNYNKCLNNVQIDISKLDICIQNKADSYYKEDSDLSKGYGVESSPTLVINGKIIDSDRDTQSYLNTVCSIYDIAPKKCENKMLNKVPSPGFDITNSSSGTNGSCGD